MLVLFGILLVVAYRLGLQDGLSLQTKSSSGKLPDPIKEVKETISNFSFGKSKLPPECPPDLSGFMNILNYDIKDGDKFGK